MGLGSVASQTASSSSCRGGFKQFGQSCYAYINLEQTWADAQATCTALGGFLAEVYTDVENEYLKQLMRDHGGDTIWLGGDDLVVEGTWYWAKSQTEIKEY